MFNKLKQLKDLRSQAKNLQNMLGQETIEIEKKGIRIKMNGNLEILSIDITEDYPKEKIGEILAEAVNEAIKKAQRIMAQKMQEMGGIPGLN